MLVGRDARIPLISLYVVNGEHFDITSKSVFLTLSGRSLVPSVQRRREIICFSFIRRGRHLRRPAHRCTTRVSVACALNWTGVPLDAAAAISHATIDETGGTLNSMPIPKCWRDVTSLVRS